MKYLFLLFLISCSGMKTLKYAEVNQYPKPAKDKVMFYFIRGQNLHAGAINYDIHAMKEGASEKMLLGSVSSGAYFVKEMGPGKYTFSKSDMWGASNDLLYGDFRATQTHYFLIAQRVSGTYSTANVYGLKTYSQEIIPIKEADAKKIMAEMRQVEP